MALHSPGSLATSVRVQAQQQQAATGGGGVLVCGRRRRRLLQARCCSVSMRETTSSRSWDLLAEQRECAGTEGNHEGGNGARAESRALPLSSGASRSTRGPHPPTDRAATTWPAPTDELHYGPVSRIMLQLRILTELHARTSRLPTRCSNDCMRPFIAAAFAEQVRHSVSMPSLLER